MLTKGIVHYRDQIAGVLERTQDGFVFQYDPVYVRDSTLPAISATLPKRSEPYRAKVLFPFFFGLLAEGAQKERQCRELRIDERDHFTRLLETSAYGAIGAVYVTP